MALKLPHSVFCHVGRTAGHWVRRAIEDQGLARGQIAGFHDWPSRCRVANPEIAGAFTFCFIRHPLSWLRSYWMHNMQFGWEDLDEYARELKSWKFDEFLERAIEKYPDGPVSLAFAPFLEECSFIGRQENLAEDLITALTKAGEVFDPEPIRTLSEIGIPIDADIREHAKAPLPLLRKVMEMESKLCTQWGYRDIPQAMVGEARPFVAAFCDLTLARDRLSKTVPFEDLISPNGEAPVTPCMRTEDGYSHISWGSLITFRKYTSLKRNVLDGLEVEGKDVLCLHPREWVIPLYLFGKGAKSVTVVSDCPIPIGKKYSRALARRNFKSVQKISDARAIYPKGLDIVLSLGEMAGLRHPFYYLDALGSLVKPDGILVLETITVEVTSDIPLLFCPTPQESPESGYYISYFNRKGLQDALTSFGFSEIKVPYEDRYAVINRGAPYFESLLRTTGQQHSSDSGFARCAVIARKKTGIQFNTLLQTLWSLWKKEIESAGGRPSWWKRKFSTPSFTAIPIQIEEIRNLQKQEIYWRDAHKDRKADVERLLKISETLDRDLKERTQELIETRTLLIERTQQLEESLAGQGQSLRCGKV